MGKNEGAIKICLLTDSFYPIVGGGEAHARLLSEKLIAAGMIVFVLTQRRLKKFKKLESIGTIPVIRVSPSGMKRFGKYFMQVPAFLYLLKHRADFDILFVCGLRALGLMAVLTAKLLGKQCVLRAESCDEMKANYIINSFGFFKSFMRSIISLRNRILFKADGFISISSAIRQEYVESGVPFNKIKDLTNGIDIGLFHPANMEEKRYLRKSLNLPNKIIFSYSGKLNRGKGLEMLLRAWRYIVNEYDNTLLVLVGSGGNQFLSCEKELRDYSTYEGIQDRIIFTGYVENVADYLRASDYFVLPSESEALSISILEALSCGIPTIATKAGGITDILEDGRNALLIDINDEAGLRKAMLAFLQHPDATIPLRAAGLETIRTRYNIELISSQYLCYFTKITETKKMLK